MPAPVAINARSPPNPASSFSYSYNNNRPGSLSSSFMALDPAFHHPSPSSRAILGTSLSSSYRSDTCERLPRLERSFCQGYHCCGQVLNDLHGLLEHFEEKHVLQQPRLRALVDNDPYADDATDDDIDDEHDHDSHLRTSLRRSHSTMDVSESPRPSFSMPSSPRHAAHALKRRAVDDLSASFDMDLDLDDAPQSAVPRHHSHTPCLAPALLYEPEPTMDDNASTLSSYPDTPVNENSPSPIQESHFSASSLITPQSAAPQEIPVVDAKPYRCQEPGCDKSYKQANGLKYHRLHGHCNQNALNKTNLDFKLQLDSQPSTPSVLSAANSPITSAPPAGVNNLSNSQNITPSFSASSSTSSLVTNANPVHEKPFACYLGPFQCTKRYKNMNGLRYHYQHAGAHGKVGLEMLTNGTHPPPSIAASQRRIARAESRHNTPTPGNRATTPKLAGSNGGVLPTTSSPTTALSPATSFGFQTPSGPSAQQQSLQQQSQLPTISSFPVVSGN